jgi:hypothetical protein
MRRCVGDNMAEVKGKKTEEKMNTKRDKGGKKRTRIKESENARRSSMKKTQK